MQLLLERHLCSNNRFVRMASAHSTLLPSSPGTTAIAAAGGSATAAAAAAALLRRAPVCVPPKVAAAPAHKGGVAVLLAM